MRERGVSERRREGVREGGREHRKCNTNANCSDQISAFYTTQIKYLRSMHNKYVGKAHRKLIPNRKLIPIKK